MMNNDDLLIVQEILSEVYKIPKESIVPELFDFFKIVEFGARKYAANGWLERDGSKTSHVDMHSSMFRHLAQSSAMGILSYDEETKLDPLLHLACRSLMMYVRRQRRIKHPED